MSDTTPPTNLLIPALAPLYTRLEPVAWLLIRLVCGVMLIPFGSAKLFDAARFANEVALFQRLHIAPALPFAWFICCLEFFGGIALALGLLTRPLALAIATEMAVITFVVMIPQGRPYQLTLMWSIVALAIALGGAGRYSLDRLIGREL